MTAGVLLIGLDAAEATLIELWAASGELPTFARLAREGAVCRMGNSLETLPGAIWPEIASGRSCGKAPLYYHPRQLHTGEAMPRPVGAEEVDPERYYWSIASRAGRRVAVIDLPQTVRCPSLNGVQLFEWGLHDRNFAIASDPPELLRRIRLGYGDHPVTACDTHGECTAGYERLLGGLLDGARRKTRLMLDIIGEQHWDLFTAAYGETHCVGHQFWHFGDQTDRGFDRAAPRHLRAAIRDVYGEIDSGIGRLIDAAGPGAYVMVFTSHGMGRYRGGPQLLPDVLRCLGMSSDAGNARGVSPTRWLQRRVGYLPQRWQPLLHRLADKSLVRRLQSGAGCLLSPLQSRRTRAVALRNNRCGAIRINLKGREPFGRVEAGAEADALIETLRRELGALRQPGSGEPIVDRVVTATEAFGPGHHPDVPDLMVLFRTDLGYLEDCESPAVGQVHVPVYHPHLPRTGDHTAESRLWIVGPGVPAGKRLPDANVLDIAPTVLRLLGVDSPPQLDGRPLSGIGL